MKVIDDTHQLNGDSGWNGDSVQVVLSTADRTSVACFFNYGLSNLGTMTLHHITGVNSGTGETRDTSDISEAAIVRNERLGTTIYELKYPAAAMGVVRLLPDSVLVHATPGL